MLTRQSGARHAAPPDCSSRQQGGGEDIENSPQALHTQVMRNAYIIAQSQLLQLAKQMEYDADISEWESEVHEKMHEFWDQTRHNVDEFCARMRYVHLHLPTGHSRMINRALLPMLLSRRARIKLKLPLLFEPRQFRSRRQERCQVSTRRAQKTMQIRSTQVWMLMACRICYVRPVQKALMRKNRGDPLLRPLPYRPSRQAWASSRSARLDLRYAVLKSPSRENQCMSKTRRLQNSVRAF